MVIGVLMTSRVVKGVVTLSTVEWVLIYTVWSPPVTDKVAFEQRL